VFVDLAEMT
jgi:hypothetical protein